MAWIETIDEAEPGSALAGLYEQVRDAGTGQVDNIMKVHSLHEEGLAAHAAVYEAVMRGTAGLRRVERELIAYAVSMQNGCHY